MTSPLKSPLIPLPPSTTHKQVVEHDPNDLFESLFTTKDSIFQSQRPRGEGRGTFSSYNSDFGAFVSVPASEEAKEHPLLDLDEALPHTETKSKVSDFFDQIAGEAKRNNEQNEQRVVNTILEHEQDPMLWLKQSGSGTSPPYCSNPSQSPSNIHSQSHPVMASHLNTNSHSSSDRLDPWVSTGNDRSATLSNATLPRKWMSSLLNTSVPALPYTLNPESAKPQPQQRSVLPTVTHVSPFAPHTFVPPSGAPGFAGDYSWNRGGFEFDDNDPHFRRLKLEGRRESTFPILTLELAEQIRANFPPLSRLVKSWTLLYSMDQHGISLQTLYARCASKASSTASTLVVVQDSEDCTFGVWLGGTIHVSHGYYGTGDSFLWSSRNQRGVQVFKWSGKNEYVAFCDKDFISFGGGDGKYGLYLGGDLADGSSAPCPTFDNPVLSGRNVQEHRIVTTNFECVGIEIWSINK